MTEAEIIESMGIYFALVSDMLPLYLTTTSGFLIVAYLVGKRLTTSQMVIISGLYLTFALVTTYLSVGYGLRGLSYIPELQKVSPSTELYGTKVVPIALGVIMIGGVIASLKFMWDIRRASAD